MDDGDRRLGERRRVFSRERDAVGETLRLGASVQLEREPHRTIFRQRLFQTSMS